MSIPLSVDRFFMSATLGKICARSYGDFALASN
jgi:hypothetical protein